MKISSMVIVMICLFLFVGCGLSNGLTGGATLATESIVEEGHDGSGEQPDNVSQNNSSSPPFPGEPLSITTYIN